MADLSTILVSIHPADGAVGVITTDQIWVLLDREIDEDSVKANFFIEGPDTDTLFGPDVSFNLPQTSFASSQDLLGSPGFRGIVAGTITFEKISNDDLSVYSGFDTSGAGNLFRHRAIFTPSQRLAANTKYKVHLVGDEDIDDALRTGIKARSVFDTAKGSNLGTGEATFVGSYAGTLTSDRYHIRVTTAGAGGVAEFEWWKDSASLVTHGPIQTSSASAVLLELGVSIRFLEGTFSVDDEFATVVERPEIFSGNIVWEFETGSGSISAPPSTASTTVLGDTPTTAVPTVFAVSSIKPANRATHLPVSTNRITITFNKAIDPTTVSADKILLYGYPVNGDELLVSGRIIYKDVTVSGQSIILDI